MLSGIEMMLFGSVGFRSTLKSKSTGLTLLKTSLICETGIPAQVMFPPEHVQGAQFSPLGQADERKRKLAKLDALEGEPDLSKLFIAMK